MKKNTTLILIHISATLLQDTGIQPSKKISETKDPSLIKDVSFSKEPAVSTDPPSNKEQSPARQPNQDNKVSSTKRTKKSEYTCTVCNTSFVTLLTLKQHSEGHKKNDCSKCSAKFAKRRQLVNHLKAVHLISTAEKYYECPFCPRRFVKKPSLWFHFTVHAKVIISYK
jgi:uncharacterized Zn-finger protein